MTTRPQLIGFWNYIYWYCNRDEEFRKYFTWDKQHSFVYCNDVGKLVSALGIQYEATEWRLFSDSSVKSMKAVLLHIGNTVASVPVTHSVKLKKCYLDMKHLLKVLRYDLHQWKLCGDLKMIAVLLGLQGRCTKFLCFLCLWDSRADGQHNLQRDWPVRETFTPGVCKARADLLVNPRNILLPPLHIKLGPMKNFVKAF